MSFLTMSQKEVDRYGILKRVLTKELNGRQAAELLHLSTRQIRRLKIGVREKGAEALMHRHRGKSSNNRMPDKERQRIAELLRKHYADFKPTFAAEKLRERHRITRDPNTIRSVM